MSETTASRVPAHVLATCFWRSLFLQAAWNRRGMQNLGFAYAIDPALRALYPDQAQHRTALGRHLGFFNCHPYTAAAILGGAIHHEEKVAAGAEPPATAVTYKGTLQGPLAAIGDGFFWTALRPFFGALAAVAGMLWGWQAVLAALVVYNAVHLTFRIGFFRMGYGQGDAVIAAVAKLSLPAFADRLRLGGAALCGLAAAVLASRADLVPRAGSPVLSVLVSVLGYFALARGVPLLPATYAAIVAGLGAAFAAGHFHGGPW